MNATTSASAVDRYTDEFTRAAGSLAGQDLKWLREGRERALQRFTAKGFPTQRDEAWKYTNLAQLERLNFRVPAAADALPEPAYVEGLRYSGADTRDLVFVNGSFVADLSATGQWADGVLVTSLAEALQAPTEALTQLLNSEPAGRFAALNTAFMHDGAYLNIADGVTLEQPIHLLFIATQTAEPIVQCPRIVITAGSHARVSVIESYIGLPDAANFTNALTHIVAADGAHIEHYKVQKESPAAYHIGNLHAQLHADSNVQCYSISVGARLARHDMQFNMAGAGACAGLFGLFMGAQRQHVDHHTRVDHLVANTQSEENFRGILDGHARGVFNGKVVVHADAQHTDAAQSNKNLLLSDNAEVDTKPELEIYADDVKCAHGATVGQLDENAMFYLLSRGIDGDTARGLLTYAFVAEIIDRINFLPLRQRLATEILGHMPAAATLEALA